MKWRDIIKALSKHPENATSQAMRRQASSWDSCAVGEHRARLEHQGEEFDEKGQPRSIDLFRLGAGFADCIRDGAYIDAALFLDEIEQYAARGVCMNMYYAEGAYYGIHRRIIYRRTMDSRIRPRWACADADELDPGAYWREIPKNKEWRWCEEPDFAWRLIQQDHLIDAILKYQPYRHRNPQWVQLYREILAAP